MRAWLLRSFDLLMVDVTQYLKDCKLILVSNREPYEHMRGAQAESKSSNRQADS